MKKSILVVLILCFAATGCTGSFNLTKKVYNLHRSQDDKWKDEFVFLVVAILPIYGISTLADALVFNSIEFWTGENPVALNDAQDKIRHVKNGKAEATLSYNAGRDKMTIASKTTARENPKLVLERSSDMILAKNEQGDVVFSSMMNNKGDITVYDQNLKPVKTYSSREISTAKEKYLHP